MDCMEIVVSQGRGLIEGIGLEGEVYWNDLDRTIE